MGKDRQSFVFYFDWLEVLKNGNCSREDIIDFLEACVNFADTGQSTKLKNPYLDGAFTLVKNAIARDKAKYEDVRRKRAESGKKGGIQKQINRIKNNNENTEIEKPDHEIILNYFLEIGGTEQEARKFIFYNDNNNWSFNGHFKTWKEAAEAWHKKERDTSKKKKNGFLDMALTRNYDYTEIERKLVNLPTAEENENPLPMMGTLTRDKANPVN